MYQLINEYFPIWECLFSPKAGKDQHILYDFKEKLSCLLSLGLEIIIALIYKFSFGIKYSDVCESTIPFLAHSTEE